MDYEKLIDFIVDSKRKGYASNTGNLSKSIKNAHEILNQEGNLTYRDLWYGSLTFAGIETVMENENPVWSMVYSGGMLDENGNTQKTYAFLKKALYLVEREAPYRGPKAFSDGVLTYHNDFSGEFDYFMGYESIESESGIIYELHYSGGSIIQ
ncbi:DUF5680 domain-containing protein [Cuniculiplasma sp. SKW3]|uniref:DUF5680 domain-containing protein n=1 Tax=Cuniculiplasma sp. SKW3 TaxID=3400170 RepID=UPI003FD168B0